MCARTTQNTTYEDDAPQSLLRREFLCAEEVISNDRACVCLRRTSSGRMTTTPYTRKATPRMKPMTATVVRYAFDTREMELSAESVSVTCSSDVLWVHAPSLEVQDTCTV